MQVFMKLKSKEAEEVCPVEWKPVVGYEGYYSVSNDGRVRSEDRDVRTSWGFRRLCGLVKGQSVGSHGYRQVTLCLNGDSRVHLVHQLVAAAFIGKRPIGKEIDHRNRDKGDNRRANLRYVTRQLNAHNAYAKGCCWDKSSGKWRAVISVGGNPRYLGYYGTEQEAHSAYLAEKRRVVSELEETS